jgi:hypothetical protein
MLNQLIDTVLTFAAALVALDTQHVELAHDVAEDDGAVTRHSASRFSHGSGAAVLSSAERLPWLRSPALLLCVHRRTSPTIPGRPIADHGNRMATA